MIFVFGKINKKWYEANNRIRLLIYYWPHLTIFINSLSVVSFVFRHCSCFMFTLSLQFCYYPSSFTLFFDSCRWTPTHACSVNTWSLSCSLYKVSCIYTSLYLHIFYSLCQIFKFLLSPHLFISYLSVMSFVRRSIFRHFDDAFLL